MTAAEFDREWERCAPWLEAALKEAPPTHTLDDVKLEVRCGDAKFWHGQASAVVTQIEVYPRAKAFTVWLAGGDMHELVNVMLPKGEAEARALGCTFMAACGRPGWARRLGWRPIHYTCAKELT